MKSVFFVVSQLHISKCSIYIIFLEIIGGIITGILSIYWLSKIVKPVFHSFVCWKLLIFFVLNPLNAILMRKQFLLLEISVLFLKFYLYDILLSFMRIIIILNIMVIHRLVFCLIHLC